MKKYILSALFGASSLMFSQELVWSNSFESPADLTGWNLQDLDGNGNNWIQGKNWYISLDGTPHIVEGTANVLRYNLNKLDGSYVDGYANEDNWIISPEIDLTSASGLIQLAVNWNKQDPRASGTGRYVYVSETPDIANFQQMQINVSSPYYFYDDEMSPPLPTNLNEFGESLFDLSSFAGKKIYIGLAANADSFEGTKLNIDEMAIYAEKVLATTEVKAGKSLTKVMQNPVGNTLMLQLNPAMAAAKTAVQVYSAAGQQMLNAKYSREVSVAQLAPGMYIARVTDGTITETVKFIKK